MPSSASTLEAVEAVLPGIKSRKMMGEYLLYRDGILFGGIYDDRLLLKITKASARMLRDCPSAFPYDGGGEMILFPEPYDPRRLGEAVDAICAELSGRNRARNLYHPPRDARGMAYVPVKCPSCGKVNQFDSTLVQAFCAYCGCKCTWGARAEAGDVKAQYELAEIYRNGKGVVQDNYEALKWFTKAADQGDPYAMYQLGIMYSSGLGTPRNCAKAVKCFSDAREHGLGKQQRLSPHAHHLNPAH